MKGSADNSIITTHANAPKITDMLTIISRLPGRFMKQRWRQQADSSVTSSYVFNRM